MSRTAMVAWDHTWKALLISVEYPSYLGGSRELIFLSLDVTRSELFLDNSPPAECRMNWGWKGLRGRRTVKK